MAPADLVEPGPGGVRVDWTTLQILARSTARGSGVGSLPSTLEQQARAQVGPMVLTRAREIEVRGGVHLEALLDASEVGDQVGSRVGLWEVTEATYYASGAVTLEVALSLPDVLMSWTVREAVPRGEVLTEVPEITGLVVDARGIDVVPALAPRVLDPAGVPVFDGRLWADRATEVVVVRYVVDAAHPAAVHAGARPLFVRAAGAAGSDVLLGSDDAAAARAAGLDDTLRDGALVVILDPF